MNIQARIDHFFTLGNTYLNPNNDAFKEAKWKANQQNPWFLPAFIDIAAEQIRNLFLQKEPLTQWVKQYQNISETLTGKNVGIVMAGNIPMVGFHDLLSTLIAGHTAVVKLSSKDTPLMEYIIHSLQNIDPLFKDLIIQKEQLKNCNAYIATGSNHSGLFFEQYFGKYPHIIRKNKTSVAILEGNETSEQLSMLADDMMQYFGLGCRNVTQIWVPKNYDFIPLLNALKKYTFLLDEHKYKNNYDYQLALLLMNRQFFMDAGGILLSEQPSAFAAISHIHYQFYDHENPPILRKEEIQCIVGNRYLAWGSLQKPRLDQYADGVDTVSFLVSI